MGRYTFSGHESFPCKTLWLKKGYDFIKAGCDFNSSDAVVNLGVGKNMVASIRFWMRAFGMSKDDRLTDLANYLLDTENGKDPYLEDLGTLWILHFNLVAANEASLYNLLFMKFQKERKQFDRQHVLNFVKRVMTEDDRISQFNENTVKQDVGTLLQNYVLPLKAKSYDDYSSLLVDLDLLRYDTGSENYSFNLEGKRQIPWQVFLYAVLVIKGQDNTVSYDELQKLGLAFCMTDMEVIGICREIESHHQNELRYSDTAGIRQMLFMKELSVTDALNEYYD